MLIANPIYDSVFKYLMEDLRVARVILQTIIGQKIESIEVTPRERTAQIASLGLRIFRLDFSAVVLTDDGERKNVLIELQKADGGDEIRRFRRYLAENYYAEAASHLGAPIMREDPVDTRTKPAVPVLPIITIYILGYPLPGLEGHSAVRIARTYRDAVTEEEIPARVEFIECLTHDCHVIQLSELKERRRNKLEELLALFEQMNLQQNEHLKDYTGEVPGEFKEALDRLRQAALDKDLRDEMELEDEVLSAWKERERKNEQALAEAKAREEDERSQKEDERRQKEEALAELARLKNQLAEQKAK